MDEYRSFREAGVSASLLNSFFTEWEKVKEKVQFHSMVLLRHGKHVMTADFSPYDSTTAHMLFSLSKSFTSAAAGFAVSEGLLRWDTPVTDLLREEIPEGREEELKQVTLESLLVMGSGLDEASDSPSPDPKVTWARHVLSFSVKYPPMTHFHYNTFGTYLISCMVEKAAGQSLTDYLAPRLFDKLGIEKPVWEKSPEGVCCGGFGLYLSAESISRFGQCLLDGGRYNGEQVLPEGWTELATREHIANYTGAPEPGNEWAQGYGFQFWRCIGGRYRGDGAMGQLCLVDEAHDAVLAVTCGTGDMGEEYRLIREYLIPALDGALPEDSDEAEAELKNRIAGLSYDLPQDDGSAFSLPAGTYAVKYEGTELTVAFEKGVYGLVVLDISFGSDEYQRFYLPRGSAALCSIVYAGMQQPFFGCCTGRNGRLHVSLRCLCGPACCEGVFYTEDEKLIFDGTGVDFPSGHVEFTAK